VLVKPLSRELIDVFFEKGWNNWARFEIKRIKGKAFLIKKGGMALPNALFKQLCQELKEQ